MLVEKGNDGIVIVQDGKLKFANSKICEMTGYSKEEMLGKPLSYFVSLESIEKISEIYKEFENKTAERYEIELISVNGKRIHVEVNTSKIDYSGSPAIMAIIRDITERKKMERALKESEENYRVLIENCPLGIFKVNKYGKIEIANESLIKILNSPSREAIMQINFLNSPLFVKSGISNAIRECIGTREPVVFDVPYRSKWGEYTYIMLFLTPLLQSGKVTSVQGIVEDITHRKYSENSLIQLKEVLRMINKILRHDLLNDLTVMGNLIETYRENRDEKLLSKVMNTVERSVELIRRMKELEALVSSGRNLKAFSAKDAVEKVMKESLEEEVVISVEGDATVLADEAFSSVIENMIRNSIIHGKADRIEVTIEDKGDFCEIRIADDGKGIPDEIKEEIFEEGFSGDSKSTGLGLYIARKTIERYGGSIKVEDNHPKGAVFVIMLKTVSDYSGIRSSLGIPVSDSTQKVLIEKKDDSVSREEVEMPEEVELDLKGLKCPQPILKLHSKVVTLAKGTVLRVVADCPTFERDLQIWAAKTGKTVLECVKNGEIWNARVRA